MNLLVIAGEQVTEFVSEREALPGRNVRSAQNDRFDLLRGCRQTIEACTVFDDDHIDAEDLLDEGYQVADGNRATRTRGESVQMPRPCSAPVPGHSTLDELALVLVSEAPKVHADDQS